MTNTYKIPLTKDGEIDYRQVENDIGFDIINDCLTHEVLKALVTHVVEECATVVLNKYHVKQGPYQELAQAIRQRGKELSDEG